MAGTLSTCRSPFSWEERKVRLFFRMADGRDPGRDSSLHPGLSLQRRKASGPPCTRPLQLLSRRSLLGAPSCPQARPSVCGGGRSPVSLSGDPASQSSGVLPISCLPFCVPGLHFCSPGWDAFQGACYKHFSARRSWEEAENKCRMYGAHLASISTPEEQDFINSGLGTGREATLATCSLIHTFPHSSVSQLKSVLLTPLYVHSGTHYLVYLIHSFTFPSCLPPSHSTRGQWGFWQRRAEKYAENTPA